MAKTAKALATELAEKRRALQAEFDSYKTDEGYDIPSDRVIDFRRRNDELDTLGKAWEDAREVERMAADNASQLEELDRPNRMRFESAKRSGDASAKVVQSIGETIAGKMYGKDGSIKKDVDLDLKDFDPIQFKTTMTTAAGFAPENLRSGLVVLSAQRPITMLDILPMIAVGTGNAYTYMSETTFTNNAAEIAENDGTGAPESALAYTEAEETIRRVATFLPITDEQLADVVGMQGLVNSRLSFMVQQRASNQLLNGNNSAPNLNGFYNRVTQAQAKSTDPVFDAIFKGMIKVMHTGYANPSAIVLHPNDWQDIRLTRTTDGIYIMGNPQDPGAERLFGLPVVVTNEASEGTGLVGDFANFSFVPYRQGIEVKVSDSHSDYFIKYLQAVRVSLRMALVVTRISAFCEVTGI
jgi:HK97 family phage major capsid protein